MQKTERTFTDGNLLKTFAEIAECKNLTLAASRLHRSQSAISVQVRKLEEELGTALFVREGKGMSLTADGVKLLPVAKRSLAELAKAKSLFAVPLNGRIRVGIPEDFDEGVLERALSEFRYSNPGVEVSATSGCTAPYAEAVRNGDLDMAVCSAVSKTVGDVFREQQAVWAASESLTLRPSAPVPLAIIDHGCWLAELPKVSLDKIGRSHTVAFECKGILSQKSAIRSGFAVGVIYESSLEQGMKVLGPRDNFPPLPKFKRSIFIGDHAPRDLANAMADAIRHAV